MKSWLVIAFAGLSGVAGAGALDEPRNVFMHFPNVNVDAHMLRVAQRHFADIREGKIPPATNELARARQLPSLDWEHATPKQIARWFRRTLHAWAIGGTPEKAWRVSNEIDVWNWVDYRSDAFWTSQHLGSRDGEMNPMIAGIQRVGELSSSGDESKKDADESEGDKKAYEALRRICAEDECARDVIVAIGLVCRNLPVTKRLAMELAAKSEVNWPVYAMRIPPADAAKLLAGRQEYAQLLSNLAIAAMVPGMERCRAIKAHLAKFPDYTEADMPKTSIALNTRAELAAAAGADLVAAGDWKEAMELWLTYGACPEDVALVAEQLLSMRELEGICRRFPPKRGAYPYSRVKRIWAEHCSHVGGVERYLIEETEDDLRHYVRTILAKRLMRAGRGADAVKWFADSRDVLLARRYVALQAIATDEALDSGRRASAYMTLGALMRQGAYRLFGTELEPDNMICDGQYACEWAVTNVALRQERKVSETERFHYRRRTAECYENAAALYDDDETRAFAEWARGNILRFIDTKAAYADYQDIAENAPGLIGKFGNSEALQVAEALKSPYREWYREDNWLVDDPLPVPDGALPQVKPAALPPHEDTAEDLLRVGHALLRDMENADADGSSGEALSSAALYAFYLAGRKGSASGLAWSSILLSGWIGDYTLAAAFVKAAQKLDENLPEVQCAYAGIAHEIGLQHEAYGIFKRLADAEDKNLRIAYAAACEICELYDKGKFYKELISKTEKNRYEWKRIVLKERLGLPSDDAAGQEGRWIASLSRIHYYVNRVAEEDGWVEDMNVYPKERRLTIDRYPTAGCYELRTNSRLHLDHVCNDDEWAVVMSKLITAHMATWNETYVNSSLLQGPIWQLVLFGGTNDVRISFGVRGRPWEANALNELWKWAREHPKAVCHEETAGEVTTGDEGETTSSEGQKSNDEAATGEDKATTGEDDESLSSSVELRSNIDNLIKYGGED